MLWVILICGLATFILLWLCRDPHDGRPVHHDSMKGSFYEISNRKDKF